MLFEAKGRNSPEPMGPTERMWEFYDRSARPEIGRVRDFLEECLARIPEHERRELISRFQSNDDRHFRSAFFELLIFNIFTAMECTIEIHPELPGDNQARPDFLVTTPHGDKVYVEAVLASEYSEAERAAQRRTGVVLDAIGRLQCDSFFIGFDTKGHPDHPPRGRRLRTAIERWLATLNADRVIADMDRNGTEAIPRMTWQEDDWTVSIQAFPIRPERRGRGQRVVGAVSHGGRFVDNWRPIRDALQSKANKYGELPHPLVVAVNFDALALERIDEMQALFGEETFVLDRARPEEVPRMERLPNGAWMGPDGPRYTRLTGAWIFRNLEPSNTASCQCTLYQNPYAQRELPGLFHRMDHAMPTDGVMDWRNGDSIAALLGLPTDWPEMPDQTG
jgi:hypothetical protein